jgi:serine/threonine protein kinase
MMEQGMTATWDGAGDMSLTGQTLGARYSIERRVGEGGMAHVYLARDLESDREVAIKVLLPQLASDSPSVERLRREAVIAMQLDHPNVCPIVAVNETPEGHLYLVMPFLPGEPLIVHQARHGPWPVSDGIPLLIQVCHGLRHAHGLQILHRDLKPENVMVVPDRDAARGFRAVVMDFGLAKVLREDPALQKLTRSGIVLGTPEFMSPEQLLGYELDPRSDLYATGVLAFEMFTGPAQRPGAPAPVRAAGAARDAGDRDRPGAGAEPGRSLPVHGRAERRLRLGDGEDRGDGVKPVPRGARRRSAAVHRVSVAIQFTSQVLPPSPEKDCSKRHESGVMTKMTKRTWIARPFSSSWSKNSPRPFLNSPIAGWLSVPVLLLAKLRLHRRDWALYSRRLSASMRPAGPVTSSSTRLARPFQTFRTTVVPSYSTQVVEPVSGCSSRRKRVFQVPISKSKSCSPDGDCAAANWTCDASTRVHTRR